MRLNDIKGLGESGLNKLIKAGIESPFDLACFFPFKYIDATKLNCFKDFKNNETVVVQGELTSVTQRRIKNLSIIKTEYVFAGFKFSATFFNQPFLFKTFIKGQKYCLTGRVKIFNGTYEIIGPKIITQSRIRPVIPVYKNIGIPVAKIEKAVLSVLENIKISGSIDAKIRSKYALTDSHKAFYCMHFPESMEQLKEARRSLSIENIAGYIKRFHDIKRKNAVINKGFSYGKKDILAQLKGLFEYRLTNDQDAAVKRIIELMDGDAPMNVMLQGDVGSGKTAVCFFAVAYAAANGYQSAFMAPTELLCRQHYSIALKLFTPLGIKVELLTGSLTAKEREKAKENIKSGSAKIIIGTHSLFQNDVSFCNLSLVITDEQHRFGVSQRGALENKTDGQKAPDCIVVSATPIPRTLSLVLYGDLEPIIIKEKPLNKANIKTCFVDSKVEQMYNYIFKKASINEQSYIVCPRVREPSEADDIDEQSELYNLDDNSGSNGNNEVDEDSAAGASAGTELVSAEGLYKKLSGGMLKDYVQLLHGQMKESEKSRIMSDFVCGKIKVLITTTVIEVGIDVPNATTIVIHNAERYGLSQLHQLRGRVGRGTLESYCFLLATPESYEKRLKFFKDCNDGFLLAEKDLENRGAGDFLGTRQHGQSITLSGEPLTAELLLTAKEIALQIESESEPLTKSQVLFFSGLTLN